MSVDQIIAFAFKVWQRLLRELDDKVGRVRAERLVPAALIDQLSFLAEARMHGHVEPLRVHNAALRLTQHLFALNHDFFDSSVIELVEFAFERYDNVSLTILRVDPGQRSLVRRVACWLLNEWIGAAEEVLEDLEVVTSVRVPSELIHALRDAVLQAVLAVLVINAFHEGIGEHLVGLAELGELEICLGLGLPWVSQWVIFQRQLAISSSDLFTICSRCNLKHIVVSGLVVVHLCLGRFV